MFQVEPWGSWRIWARNEEFEALVEASCDQPGTPLRAPTPSEGLQPACRDSFAGQVRSLLHGPWRPLAKAAFIAGLPAPIL